MDNNVSGSTLYPKITTHVKQVVKTLRNKLGDPTNPDQEPTVDPVPIVGTIKLHGAHADILVSNDNAITFQSRNNVKLLEAADSLGFVKAMSTKTTAILRLRDAFRTRWKALHPDQTLNPDIPIVISGEWVGEGVQKHVAVSQLSRRLVIISAKINGSWVADADYADIEDPQEDIYRISRGGVYHSILYPADPQRTIDELEPLTESIASRCPFADSFSVTGEGEGLVWKLVPYISDSDLWFKTKGGRFKPTYAPAPKKLPVDDAERGEQAKALAEVWCSEQRLEQGLDYLREKCIDQNMEGIGAFLKWVQLDILVEEKGHIAEYEVDKDMLKKEIIAIAKPWYLGKH